MWEFANNNPVVFACLALFAMIMAIEVIPWTKKRGDDDE